MAGSTENCVCHVLEACAVLPLAEASGETRIPNLPPLKKNWVSNPLCFPEAEDGMIPSNF